MDGMDGITALEHLRADPLTKEIPVVAVTGSVMTNERKKILEAGFEGYQRKPINIKEFIEAVRSALNPRMDGQDAS